MKSRSFSKGEAISFGWDLTKENLGFFIILSIIYFAVLYIPLFIAGAVMEVNYSLGIVLQVIDYILDIIVYLGFIKIAFKFYDDEEVSYGDLFSQSHLFFKFIGGMILYVLISGIGFILLIIPGVILAIKLFFFDYFIIDKDYGVIESLKESYALTKGVKFNLFLFFLMLTGINILGLLFLLVGLLVTFPMSMLATVYVYRKLVEFQEADQVVEEPQESQETQESVNS
ncbi:hypothetical protein [Fuchsiella alkaliacetigena]|uniref:hypothetical protein n=1 Tax=Fuchsiella alkaliacetigena TaxID=957042 RepID=UPI00200A2E11|nr:hypothetical protein [Fuchsiella alkaliacetigena]MCK8825939.1 hypothetical protein [Fuchsiella alkaliacetigena]